MDRRQLPASGGTVEKDLAWVRPADWISMPDPTGTQAWYGIYAVFEDSPNYVALKFTAAVTVDWGDGHTENVATNTQVNHSFAWADIDSGTLSSRGYRQALVTVVPQAANNLTTVTMNVRHSSASQTNTPAQWIDVAMAGTNITSLALGNANTSDVVSFPMLERVQVLGTTGITSFSGVFGSLIALQKVNDDLDMTGVTNCTSMFAYTYGMLVAPNLNYNISGLATMTYMFQYSNVKVVPPLHAPYVTTATGMFNGCGVLTDVALNMPALANASSMFSTCKALVDASKVAVWAATNISSMFSYCDSLKVLPTIAGVTRFASATNADSMFYECKSLPFARIELGSSAALVTNMFRTCYSLREVHLKLPATGNNALTTTFYQNSSLRKAVITTGGATITGLQNTFQYCYSLRDVELPTTASCTDFQGTFNYCYLLEEPPTLDMTAATLCGNMFAYAHMLNEAPAWVDLNGVTGTGANNLFTANRRITTIPAYDMSTISSASSLFSSMPQVARVLYTGMGQTHSVANSALSATALDEIYTNLASGVTSKTITVTGNPGVTGDTPSIATSKGWTLVG